MKFTDVGRLAPRCRPLLLSLAVAGLWSANVSAFEIPSGNDDVSIRWDQTIKYNAGWRAEGRDRRLSDAWQYQAGEYQFDKGDMVTNRFDLLSEFDFVYKNLYGFRVSVAAWKDFAYDSKVTGNPAYQTAAAQAALAHMPNCVTTDCRTAYPGNTYSNNVKRYYTTSAEFLDAFIFARVFEQGEANADVKAGRHTVFWGESLYSPIHGVSYSQSPVDFRKSLATPGSEAKELFLPLNQISGHVNFNSEWSMAAQYLLEWKPYRIYEGGTYFTYADPFFQAGTTLLGRPYDGDASSGPFKRPANQHGNWGVNLKWAPGDFGTVGFYYRHFDDKVMAIVGDATRMVNGQSTLTNAYADNVKLYGVSYSKLVGGVSLAGEIVRRENTALGSVTGNNVGLARGDTWHALVNAQVAFSKNPVFDSAILAGELTYSRLDTVYASSDPMVTYKAVGYNCAPATGKDDGSHTNGTKNDGCATRDAYGLSMNFTPTWFQVMPGTDLSLLMHYDRGLKGNSPVPFGGNVNSGSWSLKLTATYRQDYSFALAYTDYFGTYTANEGNYMFGENGAYPIAGISNTVVSTTNGGNAVLRDRGWWSFTFKTNF